MRTLIQNRPETRIAVISHGKTMSQIAGVIMGTLVYLIARQTWLTKPNTPLRFTTFRQPLFCFETGHSQYATATLRRRSGREELVPDIATDFRKPTSLPLQRVLDDDVLGPIDLSPGHPYFRFYEVSSTPPHEYLFLCFFLCALRCTKTDVRFTVVQCSPGAKCASSFGHDGRSVFLQGWCLSDCGILEAHSPAAM